MRVTKKIKINIRQAPCNPVFLRWKNLQGGWGSWCFGGTQTEGLDTGGELYMEPFGDLETDRGREDWLTRTGNETMVLGAEQLTETQVTHIKSMLSSPKVEMLTDNTAPYKWKRVIVEPGSFNTWETDGERSEIEFTITMPSLYIQHK